MRMILGGGLERWVVPREGDEQMTSDAIARAVIHFQPACSALRVKSRSFQDDKFGGLAGSSYIYATASRSNAVLLPAIFQKLPLLSKEPCVYYFSWPAGVWRG